MRIFGETPAWAFARGATAEPIPRWRPADLDRASVGRPSSSPRWRLALAALGVVGLGAAALLATNADDGPTAVAEPPVAAEDLTAGAMYHVVDQIGARDLWAQGITGAGINVAVIDTGVAPVDGLADPGKVTAVVDLSTEAADPATAFVDSNGHGTHMAGIIAGRETAADPATATDHPEWFLGVAPDAGIVSVKVADRAGDASLASVVAGVEWVIAHADELDIRVINLAYSSGSQLPYQSDPLTAVLERAWEAGIVVVTPAGNGGESSSGLDSPAIDPYVIAVAGADVTFDGVTVAEFASTGDADRHPDIAAPSAHIESLRVPGSHADVDHPEGFVDDETFRGSGSSQGSAVTAGAVALLLEARPELTPDQVKAVLSSTAVPIAGETSTARAGNGLIDVSAAATQPVGAATQTWERAEFTGPAPSVPGAASIWTGATWTGATWTGATWTGATWTGATWTGATWTGATWTGATWTGATWTGATWTGATWTGATWTGATWTGATWTGATWTGATWTGATWTGATWTGATWTGATWTGATWTGATWTGATWTGATWTGATWTGATWTGATWTGATWTGATWTGATWTGATWTGATWTGATWTGATWTGATWT